MKNLKALCISLLTSHPTRRVLVMDVTEVRGYRLLTEGRNSEVGVFGKVRSFVVDVLVLTI